jgi:hypothetical protein
VSDFRNDSTESMEEITERDFYFFVHEKNKDVIIFREFLLVFFLFKFLYLLQSIYNILKEITIKKSILSLVRLIIFHRLCT